MTGSAPRFLDPPCTLQSSSAPKLNAGTSAEGANAICATSSDASQTVSQTAPSATGHETLKGLLGGLQSYLKVNRRIDTDWRFE